MFAFFLRARRRRNDLLGTLADTCRAKKLLSFRARHDFVQTMKAGRTELGRTRNRTDPESDAASERSS